MTNMTAELYMNTNDLIVNVIYSGATGGAGYVHPSGALEFTHGFQ
jgi:hypothetical protein